MTTDLELLDATDHYFAPCGGPQTADDIRVDTLERWTRGHDDGQPAAQPVLPVIAPGQLWLIEAPAPGRALSAFECRALTAANVLIYDRALAPTVAAILPLGNYAEPAADDDAALRRCLRFTLDGWSVVRLVEGALAPAVRAARLRAFADGLLAHRISADLPLSIVAGADRVKVRLAGLAATADDRLEATDRIAVACAAIGASAAPPLYAVAANGLAG